MAEITLEALAKRIEALENKMKQQEIRKRDWRSVVGMFDDDPEFMQKVLSEAEAIRETERKAAREGKTE
jgi:hypothetical protein